MPRGVVYVGAHHGEEVETLKRLGFAPIHLVEANPDCVAEIRKRFAADAQVSLSEAVAMDAPQQVTFRIASFDQSSSALKMKHHLEIHPGIREEKIIRMTASTLPVILADARRDLADYNLLCLDVQGAESRILKGARDILAGFDAVACEVNLTEVYEECGTLEEIDALLFDQGFIRVKSVWTHSDFWGDALYVQNRFLDGLRRVDPVRRGSVSMADFTRNGKFANQMFQYAFLTLYALRAGCDVRIPRWPDGDSAFDLPRHARGRFLPKIDLRYDRLAHHAFFDCAQTPCDLDFSGYFQGIPVNARRHRDFLRKCFAFKPDRTGKLSQWRAELTGNGARPLVVAHLRRGDYTPYDERTANTPMVRIPSAWAFSELETIRREKPDARIIVATDDDETRAEAKALFGDWPMPEGVDAKFADFYALRTADIVLVANSSFSFFAALLAAESQDARIVDFSTGSYRPFSAWAETDFWSRYYEEPVRPEVDRQAGGSAATETSDEKVRRLVRHADKTWLGGFGPEVARVLNFARCEFDVATARLRRALTRKRQLHRSSSREIRRTMNDYWKSLPSSGPAGPLPWKRFFSSVRASSLPRE